jgi:thiosulfate reductase cytochrome b subunit
VKQINEKHPLAIRWFHWINFPVLAIMIWSGIMIYWANDVYKLGWGDTTILKFFPDSFYKALNLNRRLSEGLSLHFMFMWLFTINGLLYVLYTFFSGAWRHLVPGKNSFQEAWAVVLYDLRLRKSRPPVRKFNGAQQIAYTSVIIMGVGSVLTGIAIYKPVQFSWLCFMLGGYATARAIHFILTVGYVLFFIIHIAQVIRAGWNNFRAIVTGFEVWKEEKPKGNQ